MPILSENEPLACLNNAFLKKHVAVLFSLSSRRKCTKSAIYENLYIKYFVQVTRLNTFLGITNYVMYTIRIYRSCELVILGTRVPNTSAIQPHILFDFSLTVKAATLIFIAGVVRLFHLLRKGNRVTFIYDLVKN